MIAVEGRALRVTGKCSPPHRPSSWEQGPGGPVQPPKLCFSWPHCAHTCRLFVQDQFPTSHQRSCLFLSEQSRKSTEWKHFYPVLFREKELNVSDCGKSTCPVRLTGRHGSRPCKCWCSALTPWPGWHHYIWQLLTPLSGSTGCVLLAAPKIPWGTCMTLTLSATQDCHPSWGLGLACVFYFLSSPREAVVEMLETSESGGRSPDPICGHVAATYKLAIILLLPFSAV